MPKACLAGGGEVTRKVTASVSVALTVFGALVMLPATASADHLFATGQSDKWIILTAACGGAIDYPADTGFFVRHGWAWTDWTDPELTPSEDRRGFMYQTTKFELYIDGELQKSSLKAFHDRESDWKFKLFVSEFHDGMTGAHLFAGKWYLDGSLLGGDFRDPVLLFTCDVWVVFV